MDFNITENDNIEVIYLKDNEEKARATCFYKNTPEVNGKRIGTIGNIETNSVEDGIVLINKCVEILKEKDINYVVGPMNENTWKQYRTLKYTDGSSDFILENVGDISQNDIFLKCDFNEIYTYSSTRGIIADGYDSEVLIQAEEYLNEEGITIRKFNKEDYINDLKEIYNVSIKSFCNNPLYTQIDEDSFIKQYEKYIQMCDDEIILLAEKEKQPIGFVFCITNFNWLY